MMKKDGRFTDPRGCGDESGLAAGSDWWVHRSRWRRRCGGDHAERSALGKSLGGTSRRAARGAAFLALAGVFSVACLTREYAHMMMSAAPTGGAATRWVRRSGNTTSPAAAAAEDADDDDRPRTPPAPHDDADRPPPPYLHLPAKATRWADTPSGQVCHRLLPFGYSSYPRDSFSVIWEAVRPTLLSESFHPFESYDPENATEKEEVQEFRQWTSALFEFYTYERLRRSQAHPAPVASVRRILQLVQDRRNDPENHDPVRIAVMGGSVALGGGSQLTPFRFAGSPRCSGGDCSYVSRLRHLLNTVIFPSEPRSNETTQASPVFEVMNLAVGGTNSEVGAMALQYHLIPTLQQKPPHVVVSSYSANDSKDPDRHKTFHVDQQAFVRAAHKLRPCDDDLPLVILADDYYGLPSVAEQALEQTGSIFKTASFHNVMAIMFSNVVRHWYMMDKLRPLALFGSNFDLHLGMGLHYGQSWTLFFNWLDAVHEACTGIVRGPGAGDHNVAGGSASHLDHGSQNRTRWRLEELPTKYRGGYRANLRDVQREWKKNTEAKELLCRPTNRSEDGRGDLAAVKALPAAASASLYRTPVCEYAWMANRATPFNDANAVRKAMDHIVVSNQGWTVSDDETPGQPKMSARTGWLTNTSKASFVVEVKSLRQPVTSLTVLSMKSYGPNWVDSKLRATVEVTTPTGPTVTSGPLEIDGYHQIQTSVSFPHRLLLDGSGAKVGDTIRATFELVQGRTFKVSGLAFCLLDDE